jgi:DNA-binding XRE family transcriptional regulator
MAKKFADLVKDRRGDPEYEKRVAKIRAEFDAQQLAWTLNEIRTQLGLTQEQLAERLGITQGAVSQTLSRPTAATSIETVARVVEALGGTLSLHVDIGEHHLTLAV